MYGVLIGVGTVKTSTRWTAKAVRAKRYQIVARVYENSLGGALGGTLGGGALDGASKERGANADKSTKDD